MVEGGRQNVLRTSLTLFLACMTGVYLAEGEAQDMECEARDTSAERDARGSQMKQMVRISDVIIFSVCVPFPLW